MKIVKHGTVYRGCGIFAYNAWPSVITLSDGTLLAGWSGDRYRHICPFGRVLAARSNDGGYTWQPPYTVLNTPLDDRDAGFCEANGHILLTRRAKGKSFAGTWENSGGAAQAGETSRQAIARELFEETGIKADEEEFEYLCSDQDKHTFYDFYCLKRTTPISEIVLLPGETDDVMWADHGRIHVKKP